MGDQYLPVPPSGQGQGPEGAFYGPSAAVVEGRHLLDYLRVVYKRRKIAVASMLVVIAAVSYYTYTAKRLYEARVQLLIEPENRNIVLFREVIEQDSADKDYQQTQHRILQSRTLARRTIDKLELWNHPDLAQAAEVDLAQQPGWRGELARLRNRALNAVGLGRETPSPAARTSEEVADAETKAQSAAIDAFLRRLIVLPVRNSRLVDVKFQSHEPALAASVANALAGTYIEQNVESKLGATKQASDWLAEQLETQRKQVEASELALQRYRESNDAMSLDEPNNIVVQKLTELNAAVTKAKTDRIEREALFRQAHAARADAATLNRLPAVLSNPYVQDLRTELAVIERQMLQNSARLGDLHPEMVKLRETMQLVERKLMTEVDRVVSSLQSQYEAALEQENRLAAALEAQKNEALALDRKAIDYGALQRDAISNRQIFETLLQRARETGISSELKSNNIQVVDSADVPRAPVWPRTRRNLLFALLGGAAFGIILAFFVDYLDNRVKSPDEIRTALGLPLLGMVPVVRRKDHAPSASPLINNGVPAKFAEAVRAVRTNVLLASGEGSRSLVITSTAPKEGKTVVATNLAIALANAGLRVVLLDADLRRPRLHQMFNVPIDPGLSQLVAGTTTAAEAFRATDVNGLSVLPAGHTSANPADILGSPRFKEWLRSLLRQFDWVVIDSPPVLAVTDASLIAHLTSGVLFVVGADRTSRHAAQAALEQLEAARAPFFGGVLNAIDLDRNPYYFAKYYRPEYGEYYAQGKSA
jgi:capsular exopolysaccharide synthesis family protein